MKRQVGFTLVELLLAAAFFGFILMFATAGFVQVNRAYNKGITVKRVHESTRQIIQDIARTIQSAQYSSVGSSVEIIDTGGLGPNYLCVGKVRYIWKEWDGNPKDYYLVKDVSFANCDEALVTPFFGLFSEETEMLDKRLAVQNLSVSRLGSTIAYKLSLTISVDEAGGSGFISTGGSSASCNVLQGDQFCDVATLETIVTLRR